MLILTSHVPYVNINRPCTICFMVTEVPQISAIVPLLFLATPCTSLVFRFLALTESSAGVISDMQLASLMCGSAVSFFEKLSSFAWTRFPVYSVGPAAASWGGSASFALGMAALSCKPLNLQESGQLDQHFVCNFCMFPCAFCSQYRLHPSFSHNCNCIYPC